MINLTRNRERGVALFFSIFALFLLTGIAAALIFMAGTETTVNSNYRQEQMAYFAAKAGIEEARARMMSSDPSSINPLLQTLAPSTLNPIIYIVNPVSKGTAVAPWLAGQWTDDELCHDYNGATDAALGLIPVAPDVHCASTGLPAGTYVSSLSQLPMSGSTSPVPYKWVRIAPKVNNSTLGPGTTITNTSYWVNNTQTGTLPVCWDGVNEWVRTAGSCQAMASANATYMNNVYVLTSLGVSSDSATAARKMLQAEVALAPTPPFPYGLFGTSTSCNPPAISFNGSNASTNSYTTAGGQTYAGTETNTGGDVGSNGAVSVQNGQIGGIVGVLQPPPAGNGTCAAPVTIGPGGTMGGTVACPTGNPLACYVPQPVVFPTPPLPKPLPTNTSYTPPSCGGKGKSGQCITPGTYGNISITGTLTMAPGTYNINSLSMTGNAAIVVNPPGALTFNVGGCGDATCSATNALANPLAIAGNGIADDNIPNDFIINYAGPGTISVTGNGDVTAILNAPNAPLTQKGNGNWYGSILVSTASIGGNAFFHYDRNAALAPANNGYYTLISFREVPY